MKSSLNGEDQKNDDQYVVFSVQVNMLSPNL